MENNKIGIRLTQLHMQEEKWKLISDFKPAAGEIVIFDKDDIHRTDRMKIGDGITSILNLPFITSEIEAAIEWVDDTGFIDAGIID